MNLVICSKAVQNELSLTPMSHISLEKPETIRRYSKTI